MYCKYPRFSRGQQCWKFHAAHLASLLAALTVGGKAFSNMIEPHLIEFASNDSQEGMLFVRWNVLGNFNLRSSCPFSIMSHLRFHSRLKSVTLIWLLLLLLVLLYGRTWMTNSCSSVVGSVGQGIPWDCGARQFPLPTVWSKKKLIGVSALL